MTTVKITPPKTSTNAALSLENEIANLSRKIVTQLKSNGYQRQSEIIEHVSAQFRENWQTGYRHQSEEDIPFLGLAVELGFELEQQLHALVGKALANDRLIVKLLLKMDAVMEQLVIRLDHFVSENETMF